MAECNDLFRKFLNEINLSVSKKDSLRQARNAIRERIKKYFVVDIKECPPKFWGQGSFSLGTIVNPINNEYDIDDGLYLQNLDKNDKNKWSSPEAVHKWIYSAVKGHTSQEPVDKRTCIRVIYSGYYHVDIPIYGEFQNENYLAEKGENGWHNSDPKAFSEWFYGNLKQMDEKVRDIIKYFKAWSDYQSNKNDLVLPSGLILTILIMENYTFREEDDIAFGRIIRNIFQKLQISFEIINPVDSNEILSNKLTNSQKNNFMILLKELLENADKALNESSKKEACKIWRKVFGDRFFNCDNIEEKKELPLSTKAPAILRDDNRSA